MGNLLGNLKQILSFALTFSIVIQTYHLHSNDALFPARGPLIIGWLLTHMVALALHRPPYHISLSCSKHLAGTGGKVDRDIWSALFFMLTPDYFWATYHKNMLAVKTGYSQHCRSAFVKYSNWVNLCCAMFIYLTILVVEEFAFPQWLVFALNTKVFQSFLLLRLVSRGVEIITAFYRDVATHHPNVRSSDLSKYKRISLAIHTYFELILSYAVIYFMLDFPLKVDDQVEFTLLDSLYYSLGIVTFTNVEIGGFNNVHKLIVYSQVITAQVLIGLSLASYIGWQDAEEAKETKP